MKKREGFTLAEVLITLGIIGVVAAMTIPTLMNHINDMQLKVAWRKAYSELSQATVSVMQDNAGSMKQLCSAMDYLCIKNAYLNHLKITKRCDGTFYGDCWSDADKFWNLNGGNPGWGGGSGAILASGSYVGFYYYAPNCDYSYLGTALCGEIIIDVNGSKRPNIVGKDIFLVKVMEDGISPDGIKDDTTDSCTTASSGRGCSAKYLYEN